RARRPAPALSETGSRGGTSSPGRRREAEASHTQHQSGRRHGASYGSHYHRHLLPTVLHDFTGRPAVRPHSAPAAKSSSPAALSLSRTATSLQTFAGDLVSFGAR